MAKRYPVRFTRRASRDLDDIAAYIAENHSAEAAGRLIAQVKEAVKALGPYPDRGAVPKELDRLGVREFRQLVLSPYRISYEAGEYGVNVLLIVDGRRDLAPLLKLRLLGR
ncbi:MAG: type II toxin-antitoxin system RelE/ParE family toxin [Novosphingobium sp.]